jgi:hypothetical protein
MKSSRYFKYAIGEIFLVVIGILIALQINNWNSERVTNKKINNLMLQVSQDIKANVIEAEKIIDYYTKKDSIFVKVLSESNTLENFNAQKDISQLYLIFSARQFVPERQGFDVLGQNLDNIPEDMDVIVQNLQDLHKNTLVSISNSYGRMDYISDTFRTHLTYNTNWFSEFYKSDSQITPEMLDYFFKNPLYKNNLTWYRVAMINNYVKSLETFNHKSRQILKHISEVVGKVPDPEICYLEPTKRFTDRLIGLYKSEDLTQTIEIKQVDNRLLMYFPTGQDYEMFFTDEETFYYRDGLMGKIRDSNTISFKTNLRGFFEPSTYYKTND